MAYKYEDFLNAATSAGMYDQFDDNDLSIAQQHPEYGLSMLSLKRDMAGATTAEQKALINAAAGELKNSYGTSSGLTPQTAQQQAATPAVAGVANTAGNTFTYSTADDPSYQAYRKQYLREGDRATAEALGQASAASAGRPSSYAVTAATQAGDYYAGQLADKVPTLYENAYNRYLTGQQAQQEQMANAYTNLASQITELGYQPTAEELAAAGISQELADQMRAAWIAAKPDLAYAQGAIDANQYYQLTGKWPNGYNTGGTGTTKRQQFEEDWLALLNDKSIPSGTINSMVQHAVNSGILTGEEARQYLIKNMTRDSDSKYSEYFS